MHGDGCCVVKRVQYFSSKSVPVQLRILLSHTNITTHTPVISMEPGEEKERRKRGGKVDRKSINEGGRARLGKEDGIGKKQAELLVDQLKDKAAGFQD